MWTLKLRLNRLSLFCLVLCLGVALRFYYYFQTPYGVRVHDQLCHLEYVGYVMDHGTIPSGGGGFEYYQPPLYYFAAAGFGKLIEATGIPQWPTLTEYVPYLALGCSILTLFVAALISMRLYRLQNEIVWRLAFVYYMAVFPGLIFMGAKSINNDTFLLLFSYIVFWQLLCFWQTGNNANWRASLVSLAAACLTKGNGLLLIVSGFGTLLFQRNLSSTGKFAKLIGAFIFLLVSCGWYYYWRMVLDQKPELCGNFTPQMDPPGTMFSIYTFNPVSVLLNPFNDIAHFLVGLQFLPFNFWEFLFRSFFFGEWMFPFVAVGTLTELLAMILMIYAGYGIYLDIKNRQIFLPGLITLVIQILGLWIYRIRLGYTSSMNNFRYIPIVMVPIFYYVIAGVRATSGWVRNVGIFSMICFGVLCFCDVILVANYR
ncbi:MAG TPA: glycosyltransferase family 39 protein [Oculatellaceae cyanobacterium]